ncbi:MBL fold metallo-hydrolase [Thermophagus sp. OGC60D27]|uniref:MBL fold metallo-hydrolase n=1 Tax=Thermophagus sp. OGC60D27 TaxID=3458415 RepID=UPI004037855F
MKIVTLVENLAYRQGTKGEHGLSFLIETDRKQILFDTGQSGLLIENAKTLNIDLASIDMVVISHGHYDHTGGLEAFFEVNNHAPVYLKPQALEDKFSLSTGRSRYIGIDKKMVSKYRSRFKTIEANREIAPGLKIITKINHFYPFEQPSSSMIVHAEGKEQTDTFEDELFMVYDHHDGMVLFAGCAHNGIANICRTAMQETKKDQIQLVLGGTHLKNASKERIQQTVKAFESLKVNHFGLCHCTGLPAFMRFYNQFPDKVEYAHVASHFQVGL